MMHQNMKTTNIYAEFEEFMKKHYKQTDELCERHDTNLIARADGEPFCPMCREEMMMNEEKEFYAELTDNHYKTGSSWLKSKSMFTDKRLKRATFEKFYTEDSETKKNKEKALEIARDYYKGASYNSILQGKAGVGKSHLAMSILKNVNEYSDPPKKCLFVALDEMFRVIKDSFNNPAAVFTEKKVIDMLIDADLLVLDDLGAETGAISSDKQATAFTIRILYSIMNGRSDKPTIITTNLNTRGIAELYDSKLASRMLRGTKEHKIEFASTKDKRLMY